MFSLICGNKHQKMLTETRMVIIMDGLGRVPAGGGGGVKEWLLDLIHACSIHQITLTCTINVSSFLKIKATKDQAVL
jgi:hypothetical protein